MGSRTLGMPDGQASAALRRSELYAMAQRYEDGLKSGREAEKLFLSVGDHGMRACSMALMGDCQYRMGMKREGLSLVGSAVTLAEECGSQHAVAFASGVLDNCSADDRKPVANGTGYDYDVKAEDVKQSAAIPAKSVTTLSPQDVQ